MGPIVRWTLVDRFLFRQMVGPYFMGLAGFFVILSVEPVNTALRNIINQNHDPWVVFLWLLARLPQDLTLAFPMATLLAALNTFGALTKSSELTALLSGGFNFFRLLVPVAWFAIFSTTVTFFFNEFVVPVSAEKRNYLRQEVMQKNLKWRDKKGVLQKTSDRKIIYIDEVVADNRILSNLCLYTFDGTRMVEMVTARIAREKESGAEQNLWVLEDTHRIGYSPDGKRERLERSPTLATTMDESSDVFARNIKETSEMSMRDLWKWISYYEKSGAVNTLGMRTEFYSKSAIPFACFLFALTGACLGVGRVRSGGFVGFGIAILIVFIYYFILSTSLSLGKTGALPPFLAAWTPNFLFLGLCFYLSNDTNLNRT